MRRGRHSRAEHARSHADDGFSLVLVLLVVGALALASTLFLQSVRGYSRQAGAVVASATLEAYADAGVQLALLDLTASARDGNRSRRFPIDGGPVHCTPGSDVVLTLRVQDEAGRVDLNVGSDKLVQALVRGLGLDKAEAIADAILDYRDSDDDTRPSGAEADAYAAAGRASGPRNAPFLSIEELGQVLGVSPEAVALLRPHVTLVSGQEGLDPSAARPELLAIIAQGATGLAQGHSEGLPRQTSLPQDLRSTSMRRSFAIAVEARSREARYLREATIELTNTRTRPFILRGWSRGEGSGASRDLDPVPPC